MSETYVGLDVGSSTCKLSAMNKDGRLVVERTFNTSEQNFIKEFKALPGEVHVHLEASSLAGWIRGILKGRVERIVISNPKMNAWIAKDARKNDRIDAHHGSPRMRGRTTGSMRENWRSYCVQAWRTNIRFTIRTMSAVACSRGLSSTTTEPQ